MVKKEEIVRGEKKIKEKKEIRRNKVLCIIKKIKVLLSILHFSFIIVFILEPAIDFF